MIVFAIFKERFAICNGQLEFQTIMSRTNCDLQCEGRDAFRAICNVQHTKHNITQPDLPMRTCLCLCIHDVWHADTMSIYDGTLARCLSYMSGSLVGLSRHAGIDIVFARHHLLTSCMHRHRHVCIGRFWPCSVMLSLLGIGHCPVGFAPFPLKIAICSRKNR